MQLNDALRGFKFHSSVSRSDYPRMFDPALNLVASASGALLFTLHMPLIIRALVPVVPTQYQKCLTMLCQITQIVVSPIVASDTLGDLEELVAQRHVPLFKLTGKTYPF